VVGLSLCRKTVVYQEAFNGEDRSREDVSTGAQIFLGGQMKIFRVFCDEGCCSEIIREGCPTKGTLVEEGKAGWYIGRCYDGIDITFHEKDKTCAIVDLNRMSLMALKAMWE